MPGSGVQSAKFGLGEFSPHSCLAGREKSVSFEAVSLRARRPLHPSSGLFTPSPP